MRKLMMAAILAGTASMVPQGASAGERPERAVIGAEQQDSSRAAIAAMRKSLLDLASMQEMHFSGGKKTYARDGASIGFRAAKDVSVTILQATSNGWSARAQHRALPGKTCVIYFGKADVPSTESGVSPTRPASLACDSSE